MCSQSSRNEEKKEKVMNCLVAFTGGGIVASKNFILRSLKVTGNQLFFKMLNRHPYIFEIVGGFCSTFFDLVTLFIY